jgi:hypothetical protein
VQGLQPGFLHQKWPGCKMLSQRHAGRFSRPAPPFTGRGFLAHDQPRPVLYSHLCRGEDRAGSGPHKNSQSCVTRSAPPEPVSDSLPAVLCNLKPPGILPPLLMPGS